MEVEGGNIVWFTYTGTEDIPDDVRERITHLVLDIEAVPADSFRDYNGDGGELPNLLEVICRDVVKKIGKWAFADCQKLRRVIMPGVEVVEECAFSYCEDLEYVECDQLKIIRTNAFQYTPLRSISLPSAEIFEGGAFMGCVVLERVTVPLAGNLIVADDTFRGCKRLKYASFADGVLLRQIQHLQLKKWRDSMNEQILSIDQILATTTAGYTEEQEELQNTMEAYVNVNRRLEPDRDEAYHVGGKARAIQRWIKSVIFMLDHYKAEHQRYLNVVATSLEPLPREIVMNNMLPFLD